MNINIPIIYYIGGEDTNINIPIKSKPKVRRVIHISEWWNIPYKTPPQVCVTSQQMLIYHRTIETPEMHSGTLNKVRDEIRVIQHGSKQTLRNMIF